MSRHFDQASSSFPKAPTVAAAVADFLTNSASNISRGSLKISYDASQTVFRTRQQIAKFFGAKDQTVAFAANVTTALNQLIKGYFRRGDHIVISGLEHNAVMRPLNQLSWQGIEYSVVPCDEKGRCKIEDFEAAIKLETRAILCTGASNICGTVLPLQEIGLLAGEHGLRFFLDSAQVAGYLPLNMSELNIDALAFTGHKSLYGPQGIGGLILGEDLCSELEPLLAGGTGSMSESLDMPEHLPDRLEAGTLNLPGIAGLSAALTWLEPRMDDLREQEARLLWRLLAGVEDLIERHDLPIRVLGLSSEESTPLNRVPLFSLYSQEIDMAGVAAALEVNYGIATRVGLHCAPLAHRSLHTFPAGSLRFSLGYSQTDEDVDACLQALEEILVQG